jgi:hypothetical protein
MVGEAVERGRFWGSWREREKGEGERRDEKGRSKERE